jgi:methylated-DNA-[protein]-cysteine S-methyltransferase
MRAAGHAARRRDATGSGRDTAPVGAFGAYESPWGTLHIAVTDRGVAAIERGGTPESFADAVGRRFGGFLIPEQPGVPRRWLTLLQRTYEQLAAWSRGERTAFDLPVDLAGISGWDARVLEATRRIPFGGVASYGEIASAIGAPRAARAVGSALGRNPVWILVPCHRVIAADGSLGGYGGSRAGGAALDVKRALLARENRGEQPPPS